MCCFSRPVRSVRDTGIFARSSAEGRQLLAYSATLAADEDLAMVLPLPVPQDTPEDAVRFVDLQRCPDLFTKLAQGFLPPEPVRLSLGLTKSRSVTALQVVKVGVFVASFVPTVADFARLDPRFQLPAGTWDRLPGYQHHGFAVIALSPGEQALHPMALEFPRKDPQKIFFPTVHIHDGQVHEQARFDHALYMQVARRERPDLRGWDESRRPAKHSLDPETTAGLVLGDDHVYRRRMSGYLPNEDTYV